MQESHSNQVDCEKRSREVSKRRMTELKPCETIIAVRFESAIISLGIQAGRSENSKKLICEAMFSQLGGM